MRRLYSALLTGLLSISGNLNSQPLTSTYSSAAEKPLFKHRIEQAAEFQSRQQPGINTLPPDQSAFFQADDSSFRMTFQALSSSTTDIDYSWYQSDKSSPVTLVLCTQSELTGNELQLLPSLEKIASTYPPTFRRFFYRTTDDSGQGSQSFHNVPDLDLSCSSLRTESGYTFLEELEENTTCTSTPSVNLNYDQYTSTSFGHQINDSIVTLGKKKGGGCCCFGTPATTGDDDTTPSRAGRQPNQPQNRRAGPGGAGDPNDPPDPIQQPGRDDNPAAALRREEEARRAAEQAANAKKWNDIFRQLFALRSRHLNIESVYQRVGNRLVNNSMVATPEIIGWASSLPGWVAVPEAQPSQPNAAAAGPTEAQLADQQITLWVHIFQAAVQHYDANNPSAPDLSLINNYMATAPRQMLFQSQVRQLTQGSQHGRANPNRHVMGPQVMLPVLQQ